MHPSTAFLFDMDGTMVNNMQYQLQAWERAVAEAGSDLKGEALFKLLYGKNLEVVERVFGKDRFSPEEMEGISRKKDAYYRELYLPHIAPITGLQAFLESAEQQQVLLAIATGGSRENVDFAVDQLNFRHLFTVVIADEDVQNSKPDPETFLKAAEQLHVPADRCIVFEDVPKGVDAARQAGMKAVVILSSHAKEDFEAFDNVIQTAPDFRSVEVQQLLHNL